MTHRQKNDDELEMGELAAALVHDLRSAFPSASAQGVLAQAENVGIPAEDAKFCFEAFCKLVQSGADENNDHSSTHNCYKFFCTGTEPLKNQLEKAYNNWRVAAAKSTDPEMVTSERKLVLPVQGGVQDGDDIHNYSLWYAALDADYQEGVAYAVNDSLCRATRLAVRVFRENRWFWREDAVVPMWRTITDTCNEIQDIGDKSWEKFEGYWSKGCPIEFEKMSDNLHHYDYASFEECARTIKADEGYKGFVANVEKKKKAAEDNQATNRLMLEKLEGVARYQKEELMPAMKEIKTGVRAIGSDVQDVKSGVEDIKSGMNEVMSGIVKLEGLETSIPRLIVVLPRTKSMRKRGVGAWLKSAFFKKYYLFFICEETLEATARIKLKANTDLLQKAMPAIYIGLKLVQAAAKVSLGLDFSGVGKEAASAIIRCGGALVDFTVDEMKKMTSEIEERKDLPEIAQIKHNLECGDKVRKDDAVRLVGGAYETIKKAVEACGDTDWTDTIVPVTIKNTTQCIWVSKASWKTDKDEKTGKFQDVPDYDYPE